MEASKVSGATGATRSYRHQVSWQPRFLGTLREPFTAMGVGLVPEWADGEEWVHGEVRTHFTFLSWGGSLPS